jgi:serine/threonine-protein kinase
MIGEMIGSHRILSQIGQGGMGTVYQAEDTRLGRKVAIKILNPSLLARGGKELERFQSEAKVQANLNHANVVTLYGFEPYKDSYCMIMEYVEGRTLADLVRAAGPLPSNIVVVISKQILDGLSAAHRRGVVHRDLKPSNIMLTSDGVAKVMDFGIAKVEGGKSLTASGALVGTVFYMLPEQVRGEPVDARSDLYSFGIILFELLTGRVPFKDESDFSIMIHHVQTPAPRPTQLLSDIPSDLEDIVLRCLNKPADQRYQSAAEILTALEAFEERQHAMGRGELYTRKALALWLAAPARQQAMAATAPEAAKPAPVLPATGISAPQSASSTAPPPPAPLPQVAALSNAQPPAARPDPSMLVPVQAKPAGRKGLLLITVVLILVLASAGLTWYRMRRTGGTLWSVLRGGQTTREAQVALPPSVPPAATNPAAPATVPPERAPATNLPSAGAAAASVSTLPGAAGAEEAKVPTIPPADRNVEKVLPASKAAKQAQSPGGAAVRVAAKSKAAQLASPAAPGAERAARQAEHPAEVGPAGGFLIFLDLDQSSERLPLAIAQSRVAEIVREAGHQVVSTGVVSTNVRTALDRNDLAEVRRNGVGHVILGTAHASVEPQTAYGSTYYVAQVRVSFELVRMSDGKVAVHGSSNAKSKGSANAQAALSEALMKATSDAARDLMRQFRP